jgi:cbb3-type cytochrome oxidase subunit 1
MNIPRSFMVIGSLYLLLGIGFGIWMGASGDHSLSPLHAHINLLGFVLMTVFGLVYRQFPSMAASGLATAHFWVHQVGALVLLVLLFLLLTGRITEAGMAPAAPIAEVLVWLGVLAFAANVVMNGR